MPEAAIAAREDLVETRAAAGRPGAVDGRLDHRRLTSMDRAPALPAGRQASDRPATRLECKICWTVYDPALGDEVWQIPPGTPFAELPRALDLPELRRREAGLPGPR